MLETQPCTAVLPEKLPARGDVEMEALDALRKYL